MIINSLGATQKTSVMTIIFNIRLSLVQNTILKIVGTEASTTKYPRTILTSALLTTVVDFAR